MTQQQWEGRRRRAHARDSWAGRGKERGVPGSWKGREKEDARDIGTWRPKGVRGGWGLGTGEGVCVSRPSGQNKSGRKRREGS